MAITTSDLQAQLGASNPNSPQVIRHHGNHGDYQDWYISGGTSYPGVVKHVRTTAADNAATQKTAVLNSLAAGPA